MYWVYSSSRKHHFETDKQRVIFGFEQDYDEVVYGF
jgi:hypothetical protein